MALSTTPKELTDSSAGSFQAVIGVKSGFIEAFLRTESFGSEIAIRRFDADGKQIGRPIVVEGLAFGNIGRCEFVELGGDKYGMVYTVMDHLMSVVIDGKTGKVSEPVTVVGAQHSSLVNELALLDNGKVALVTRDFVDFTREDTIVRILDKNMKPVGEPKIVEQDEVNQLGIGTYQQTVVENGDGGVAIYLNQKDQLEARAFDAAGKPGKVFQVNTTKMPTLDFVSAKIDFEVKAEALEGGGYVVTWMTLDKGQDTAFDLRARVIDESGKAVGKDFAVNLDAFGHQDQPEILTFDKGFAVAWTDVVNIFKNTQVLRFFDEDGKAISDEIVTEYFGADGGGLSSAGVDTEYARLSDGSYVKTFSAGGSTYGDAIPNPKFGTDKNDAISGKKADDIVLGAGGNDKLSGSSGADTLDGGEGNDTLDGGAGADHLVGGAGDDLVMGSLGADVFAFRPRAGKDEIRGFDSSDRIDVSAFGFVDQPDPRDVVLQIAKQVGDDVVLKIFNEDQPKLGSTTVTLRDYDIADLSDADLIF